VSEPVTDTNRERPVEDGGAVLVSWKERVDPLAEALMVNVAGTAGVVTGKAAVVRFVATVTEEGIVRVPLAVNCTTSPGDGAAALRVTVQLAAAPATTGLGAQVRVEMPGGRRTVNWVALEETPNWAVTVTAPAGAEEDACALNVAPV
jgi:hypothetical protein